MSNEEKNIKLLFERFSNEGDVLDDQWYEDLMNNPSSLGNVFDIDWSNTTDSGNYSSGDEHEAIYTLNKDGLNLCWSQTSSGGFQCPFDHYDDAIIALGYDPKNFPPPSNEEDVKDELEDDN